MINQDVQFEIHTAVNGYIVQVIDQTNDNYNRTRLVFEKKEDLLKYLDEKL